MLNKDDYYLASMGDPYAKPYEEYKKQFFSCEYCGEEYHQKIKFKVSVVFDDGSLDYQTEVCPDCVATFFTETPEEIEQITVTRIPYKEGE